MAEIEIVTETEGHNQWTYQVSVFAEGRVHHYDVTLSWSDYDLWCHGRVAPQKVVNGVFKFLLQHESPEQIQASFDCSLIRRYFSEVDRELPKLI